MVKTARYGPIAQLGEHLPCKQKVASSTLAGSTTKSYDLEII